MRCGMCTWSKARWDVLRHVQLQLHTNDLLPELTEPLGSRDHKLQRGKVHWYGMAWYGGGL